MELAWLKEANTQGAHKRLEVELEHIFLSPQRRATLPQALEALQVLESEPLYAVCPPSSQAMVASCKKYVQMLQRGVCPDGLDESEGFMSLIIARCS